MEALPTIIPVRILLVGSLLAAGGLGNIVSVETDTTPREGSNAPELSTSTRYESVAIAESPAGDGGEQIAARYVRNGRIGAIVVHAESDELVADVEWAVSRFDEIGLTLPEVEVFASADQAQCGNSAAYLTFVGAERKMRIRACGTRITLLHEFGHAWDVATLSDEQRTRFMELRGLDSWKADTWAEAAGEHAATVIAWGLNDRAFGQDLRPNDVTSMREAFLRLTGTRPLWEPRRDMSDHGPALDSRTFVADAPDDYAAPAVAVRQTPEFATRLQQDQATIRELAKPELRAVAGANGRVGFLVAEAAESFNAMKSSARRDGVDLSFVSAWRSWKLQQRAHEHFLTTGTNLAGNPVPNVADPDKSNHPRGLALDFALGAEVHEWLRNNADRFGWYPITSEAWHWEYRGAPESLLQRLDQPSPLPLPADDMIAARGSNIA